jgi:hypothetical protein
VESLIEENPPDSEFIPREILALVDNGFLWNVSFTKDINRSEETLQVNSVISSGPANQPPLLMSPSTSQPASAIVSASSSSSLQTAPTPSETSTESQLAIIPAQGTSTPTKYTPAAATDETPTSKSSSLVFTKKSIIVSGYSMPSHTAKTSTDTKAKIGTHHEEKISQSASLTTIVPRDTSDKAKVTTESPDESPQADPSLAPKSTPKKRGRPTETTTIAKKLFKDSTQKKPTDRLILNNSAHLSTHTH